MAVAADDGGVGGPVTDKSLDKAAGLTSKDVDMLRAALRGPVLTPSDPGYDDARKLYNGMIDKRPAAVARCVDAADVMTCVKFASNGVDLGAVSRASAMPRQVRVTARPDGFHESVKVAVGEAVREIRTGESPAFEL